MLRMEDYYYDDDYCVMDFIIIIIINMSMYQYINIIIIMVNNQYCHYREKYNDECCTMVGKEKERKGAD